jgi:hypothetical protein
MTEFVDARWEIKFRFVEMYGNQGTVSPCSGPFPYTYTDLYVSAIPKRISFTCEPQIWCRKYIKYKVPKSMCFVVSRTTVSVGP